MYFDRYDICEAYYLYGSLYHGGMGTKEYAYLGRCRRLGFTPSILLDYDHLSDNGREIYKALGGKP